MLIIGSTAEIENVYWQKGKKGITASMYVVAYVRGCLNYIHKR